MLCECNLRKNIFCIFKDRDIDQRSGRTEVNRHGGRPAVGPDMRSDRGRDRDRSDRDLPPRSFDRPRSRSRDRSDRDPIDIPRSSAHRDYRDRDIRGDRDLRDHITDHRGAGDRADLRDHIRDHREDRGDREGGGYNNRRSFSPHRDQQWRGGSRDTRRSGSPGGYHNIDDRYSGITDLENIRDHGRSRSPDRGDRFRVGYLIL